MADDTENGIPKDEPKMIIVAFSKALRCLAPPFHATATDIGIVENQENNPLDPPFLRGKAPWEKYGRY